MPNIIFKSSGVIPHQPQLLTRSAKNTIATNNLTDSKAQLLYRPLKLIVAHIFPWWRKYARKYIYIYK